MLSLGLITPSSCKHKTKQETRGSSVLQEKFKTFDFSGNLILIRGVLVFPNHFPNLDIKDGEKL